MTNVWWDMVSLKQGTLAVVMRNELLIRISYEDSAESASATIGRLYPHAVRSSRPLIQRALEQLSEYFLGKRQSFDVPLDHDALSAFASKVRQELVKVPYGTVITYGELAARAGYPGAARAVGGVMSSNPFPLIVPCHRVVNANGKIGQYSAAHGSATKAWLIDFERGIAGDEVQKSRLRMHTGDHSQHQG